MGSVRSFAVWHIIEKGVYVAKSCQQSFEPRSSAFLLSGVDPVNSCWLTKRAADGGESARFSSIFLALSFSRFDGESKLRPTAANASR